MKVLFVSWECDPIFKVGGLGDVAKSLPAALNELGADTRLAMPFYKEVKAEKAKKVGQVALEYGGKKESIQIFLAINPLTTNKVYLFKHPLLDGRDNIETFVFFDKAVAEAVRQNALDFSPEVVHCNDNHCGLIPVFLKQMKLPVKSVFTIHNLAYQGAGEMALYKKAGLASGDKESFNMMRDGLGKSDFITTVSPSYAREILEKNYGYGLNALLLRRKNKLKGILNGITVTWRQTRKLKHPNLANWKSVNKTNKSYLRKKLGLDEESKPILSYIGRLEAHQKGIDILYEAMRREDFDRFQFVILGTGDKDYENKFQKLAQDHPRKLSALLRFDDESAHVIYAASDFIIIPSKYEPCGLIQMIAMRFGAIPIARKTGGLADSIKDGYNGWLFKDYSSLDLTKTLEKAVGIYQKTPQIHQKMVENALKTDFSWEKSAGEYLDLYIKLIHNSI